MTKSSKITLTGGRDLPFSSLQLSQANVRRIQDGQSIEELAEDIARRGLLQSLSVRPILDIDGKDTGLFEVPAGGRRFRALEILVKQKRLAKDAPVPCIIRTDGLAEEDSLAENVQRVGLHPLDQFHAFKTLADKGLGEDDIAARFFVPVNVVKQRLKLAAVSEVILDAYKAGDIPLEIVMAFTVNPDITRQETVFDQLKASRDLGTYRIKRLLTDATVNATDRRVRFVTLDAYIDAGGAVLRDLFTDDNGGWLSDPALLDRLVSEKLAETAEEIKTQGWKWVEAAVDFPYGHSFDLDEIVSSVPMLSEEDSAALKATVDEYNGILNVQEETGEDMPEVTAERLEELEARIHLLENPAPVYKPEDIAIAGVFVSLDRDGTLNVDPGYVRAEDRRPEPNAPADGDDDAENDGFGDNGEGDDRDGDRNNAADGHGSTRAPSEPVEIEDTSIKPLPDALHRELTAYRTLALRDALARQPDVALTALLYTLSLDAFYRSSLLNCLEVRITSTSLAYQGGPDIKDCAAATAIEARTAAWRGVMPDDKAMLWGFLADLSDDSRAQLLAYLVSQGLNALYEPAAKPGYNGPSANSVQHRLRDADQIAGAVDLDLVAAGWVPTVDNYLGRVPKPRILLAVEQGCGAEAAARIDHLKKPNMAAEAEALLKATGWLPEPLRGPERPVSPEPPADAPVDPETVDHEMDGDGAPGETSAEFADAAE